uniref:Uncharacterized protein LOC105134154 isoform X1 n=1 Tax=Rhizophora mucronata TaxID=61149 RepID=A0A2P2JSH1_RHIMU
MQLDSQNRNCCQDKSCCSIWCRQNASCNSKLMANLLIRQRHCYFFLHWIALHILRILSCFK